MENEAAECLYHIAKGLQSLADSLMVDGRVSDYERREAANEFDMAATIASNASRSY